MAEADKEIEAVTKFCSTCKQDIPRANFEMHVVHCKRFLMRCPHCEESINKNHLDEHMKESHVKVKCSDCRESLDKMELEIHQESLCRHRSVRCDYPYCEINLPACDIDEHRESCGSRTEECENCKRRILIKDLEQHISTGCQPPDTSVDRNSPPSVSTTKKSKPTSLFYDHSNPSDGFDFGETGFYTEERGINSYIDQNFEHGFRNGILAEPVRPTVPVEQQKSTSMQSPIPGSFNKKTSSNSQVVHNYRNPRRGNDAIHDEVKPRKTELLRQTYYSNPKKKIPVDINELPEFGIPDHDSDGDGDVSRDEKKPHPDLTDETFLPCEFCNALLPADSIVMHQAMCQEAPSTPRPSNSTFPNFQSAVEDNATFFTRKSQACGDTYSTGRQDIGEGSIPCEFCFESFPLDAVAVHQTSCSQNPLYLDQSRERRRAYSPPPEPETQPPPKPTTIEPPTKLHDSKVESRRQKLSLAPTFSNKPVPTPQVTGARPKARPPPNSNVDKSERKMSKPKGGGKGTNGRSPPKSVSSVPTRTFHEVRVLGGDSACPRPALEPNSRDITRGSECDTAFDGVHSYPYGGDEFSPFPAVPRFVNQGNVPGSDQNAGYGRGNTRVGSDLPATRSKPKRGGKGTNGRSPAKPVSSVPTRNFHEVRMLGGDSAFPRPALEPNSRDITRGSEYNTVLDNAGYGRGNTHVGSGLPATRSRGNTRGNAFSNGATANRRGRGGGGTRRSHGGTRRGSVLRGQSRSTTGTVTIPNWESNPRNDTSSGIQEPEHDGLRLDGRRAPWEEDRGLDGNSRTASGGQRLGGRAKARNSRSGRRS